ncbi:MAG: hypothetical protein A2V73_08125 [candidate division Zixibacteria bacterium RBG_19FT_COMBO_42_43]|nr:MAG: hypothetical protein A2V73_08125 [candidate division Zixibacteria bacterium RBG_19FT_COMBO_42_43]
MLGGLWYSKLLFANPWMKAIGKTEAEIKASGSPAPGYIIAFVGALFTAFILATFINYAGGATLVDGAKIGFYAWLGFGITTLAPAYYFEMRPKALLLIYAGYTLVAFIIMGGILGAWR